MKMSKGRLFSPYSIEIKVQIWKSSIKISSLGWKYFFFFYRLEKDRDSKDSWDFKRKYIKHINNKIIKITFSMNELSKIRWNDLKFRYPSYWIFVGRKMLHDEFIEKVVHHW